MQAKDESRPAETRLGSSRRNGGRPCVLIAEDDREMANLLVEVLDKAGYETIVCDSGWELLRLIGFAGDPEQELDLIVSDIRLPGFSGLDALRACYYSGGFPPMILITAFGDEWTHAKAASLGAVCMFDKPFNMDELVRKVRELVPPNN